MGKRTGIKTKFGRCALVFKERLDMAKINRVKMGLDKRMVGDVRLTKALTEEPLFEECMKLIERKPNKESIFK